MLPLHIWNSFWRLWANAVPAGGSQISTDAVVTSLPLAKTLHNNIAAHITDDPLSAQEKYDLLSEYGAHILCLIDASGQCTYLSRNFETITGLAIAEQLSKPLHELLHTDFHERLQACFTNSSPRQIAQPLRCKVKHADGKWYWYQLLIRSRSTGRANDFVCVMENIHDMISAQHTLQKARLEAELALRARSEFLANMSHELRTPLNAVIGFAQIIDSEMFGEINNEHYKDYIRHIQDSGYDLLAKIEDLLEIANIDAGRVTLSKEEARLADIFDHVRHTQLHHANASQVSLEIGACVTDRLLYVDRLKLQHILGHLVSNAIRHSARGGVVSVHSHTGAEGLVITVSDQGAGIMPDKLAAILTAMQEENCWASANEHGTIGLGLALTREFVALHGGQVDVHSVTEEGTTITITLPPECLRDTHRSGALAHAAV